MPKYFACGLFNDAVRSSNCRLHVIRAKRILNSGWSNIRWALNNTRRLEGKGRDKKWGNRPYKEKRRTTGRKRWRIRKLNFLHKLYMTQKARGFEVWANISAEMQNVKRGAGTMKSPTTHTAPCTDIQSFQQSADARLPRHKSCSYRTVSSIASSHFALPVAATSLGARCKEYWDQLGMRPSHRRLNFFSYWHQLTVRQFQFINTQTYSSSRDAPISNIS